MKKLHDLESLVDITEVSTAWTLINDAQKITLLTHRRPDGDGVSACAALDEVLKRLGKEVECVYPSPLEQSVPRQAESVLVGEHKQQPDLLISCDTANKERLYFPEAFNGLPLINIDHHVSNTHYGTCNLVNGTISSACELVALLLNTWAPESINTYVAECLLFGILYDTQIFVIPSTSPQTLRVCADLVERGADFMQVKTDLISDKNPEIIRLWSEVLSSVTISSSGKAAWAMVSLEQLNQHGLKSPSLVGFSNFLARISGVDITLFFYEGAEGETRVSLRSKTSDVNALAQKFGGGGHTHAAGISSKQPMKELAASITKDL